MPLSEHGKIMIGWAAVWISGGVTFYHLQKQIEAGRKERMKQRKIKRRERQRKEREASEAEAVAASQLQIIGNETS